MSISNLEILIKSREFKANHPITCLNEKEWFVPEYILVDNYKVYIRHEGSAWFNINNCKMRIVQE